MSLWNDFASCLSDNEIKSYKLAYDKVIVWLNANQNLKGTQEYIDKEKNAESYYENVISIPVFHALTIELQDEVVGVLKKALV